MSFRIIFTGLLVALVVIGVSTAFVGCAKKKDETKTEEQTQAPEGGGDTKLAVYTCAAHPEATSMKPGKCEACGDMALTETPATCTKKADCLVCTAKKNDAAKTKTPEVDTEL